MVYYIHKGNTRSYKMKGRKTMTNNELLTRDVKEYIKATKPNADEAIAIRKMASLMLRHGAITMTQYNSIEASLMSHLEGDAE